MGLFFKFLFLTFHCKCIEMEQIFKINFYWSIIAFPGGSDGKESAFNAGDLGPVPGLGRAPGGGHSSILPWRIPKDRGAWQATVHGVKKSET